MTYLRPHNYARVRRNRFTAVALIVVAIGVATVQLFLPHIFPALFSAIAKPFWRERFMIEGGGLRDPVSLAAENDELKRKLSDVEAAYASSTVGMLEADYRDLLAIYGRASTTDERFVLGAVLHRPSFLQYDQLIIDVGSRDGISSTSMVFSPERVPIGRVSLVLQDTSMVALFTLRGSPYNVLIGNKRIPATAFGRGGGQYRAEVPHGSEVKIGDFVSDSSLYARPFGVVVSVVTDPSDPFDTVMFAPPVNLYNLRYVLVRP